MSFERSALMRYVDTLERGVLYEVSYFRQMKAGGRPEENLVAYYSDDGLEFFSFMPKKFANMAKDKVAKFNEEIKEKRPPSICYYGKLGMANIVEIHNHGEEVNEALKSKVMKLEGVMSNRSMGQRTPTKGTASGDSSPSSKSTPTKRKNCEGDGSDAEGTPSKCKCDNDAQ